MGDMKSVPVPLKYLKTKSLPTLLTWRLNPES